MLLGLAMAPLTTTVARSDAAYKSDVSMEKDETERELEKLVFGDDAGFHEGLKLHGQKSYPSAGKSKDLIPQKSNKDSEEEDIEGVQDSDVR